MFTNNFVVKLKENITEKSNDGEEQDSLECNVYVGSYLCDTTSHQVEIQVEEDFPNDNQARHDHLILQLNEEDCKSKTTNFNLMARV